MLVVEPEAQTRALLAGILSDAGFAVRTAAAAADVHVALASGFDAILLALNLPDADGLDLLRDLRPRTGAAIIVVTSRTDAATALAAGADDVITKPFSADNLVARVRSHASRQARGAEARRLEFPGLVIDASRREVVADGRVVELRRREFDLLFFLASSPGQVFGHAQLLRLVWESSEDYQRKATVTEHVRRIREQIEVDPASPQWLQTVYGVGYRFNH